MEWVLVLVIAFSDSQVGNVVLVTNIPGHKNQQSCIATLENAKRDFAAQRQLEKRDAELALRRSFCVEKGR